MIQEYVLIKTLCQVRGILVFTLFLETLGKHLVYTWFWDAASTKSESLSATVLGGDEIYPHLSSQLILAIHNIESKI